MDQSETSKFRHMTAQYCSGNGVDIGSGGDPVVPHAISVDLPDPYTRVGDSPIQWRGDGTALPFMGGSLDFVYASHLLEDFADWIHPLTEWTRVLKSGGQDARLQEIKALLIELKSQGDSIVATLADFQTALTRIDTATTEIAADIQRLLDKIAAGGLSDTEEAQVLAQIGTLAERLEGIGASVENPVPPPAPNP